MSVLRHVEHAATHLTRRDWATMFLGTVMTLAMAHLIDGGVAMEVIRVASHTLGHLFDGLDGRELPGPTIPSA